jgi:hypothetical protein
MASKCFKTFITHHISHLVDASYPLKPLTLLSTFSFLYITALTTWRLSDFIDSNAVLKGGVKLLDYDSCFTQALKAQLAVPIDLVAAYVIQGLAEALSAKAS